MIFRSNVHTLFGSPSLHYALCRSFVYEGKRVEERYQTPWTTLTFSAPHSLPLCRDDHEVHKPEEWTGFLADQFAGIVGGSTSGGSSFAVDPNTATVAAAVTRQAAVVAL